MEEKRYCPKTFSVIVINDRNAICGAPCIEDKCMAWVKSLDPRKGVGYCKMIWCD